MLDVIHAKGKPTKWKTGEEVFRWWMEDQNVEGQMNLFTDGFLAAGDGRWHE